MKNEDFRKLLRKTAFDKTGKKIGRIIHFDERKPVLKDGRKMFLFVEARKFLQRYIQVPIDSEKILEIKEEGVYFDIYKKDFDARRTEIRKREYGEDEAYFKSEPARYWFSAQSPREIPKERRKK